MPGLGFSEAEELRPGDTVIHGGRVRDVEDIAHRGKDWPYFLIGGNWVSWQLCSRDPLRLPCPQCHAGRGEKCTNYKGQGCAPHGDRMHPPAPAAAPEPEAQAGLFD